MKCPDGCDRPEMAEFHVQDGDFIIRCPNCCAKYAFDEVIEHCSEGRYTAEFAKEGYTPRAILVKSMVIDKVIATLFVNSASEEAVIITCYLERPHAGKALVEYLKYLFGDRLVLQVEQIQHQSTAKLVCPVCGGKVINRDEDGSPNVWCKNGKHFKIGLFTWAKQMVVQAGGFIIQQSEKKDTFIIHVDVEGTKSKMFEPSGYDVNRLVAIQLRDDFRKGSNRWVIAVRRLKPGFDDQYEKVLLALRSVDITGVDIKEVK